MNAKQQLLKGLKEALKKNPNNKKVKQLIKKYEPSNAKIRRVC